MLKNLRVKYFFLTVRKCILTRFVCPLYRTRANSLTIGTLKVTPTKPISIGGYINIQKTKICSTILYGPTNKNVSVS